MRLPFGWLLVALAAVATALALWAGSNLALAVPAGVVAVAAAAFLFGEAWLRHGTRRAVPATPLPAADSASALRTNFRSGPLGREAIVVLLDRLEREGLHPELPARRPAEFARFARLSPAEFRRYVRDRLDELEAGS